MQVCAPGMEAGYINFPLSQHQFPGSVGRAPHLVSALAIKKSTNYRLAEVFVKFFKKLFMVLPGMTQLTRKSPIALRLILRGSPGPTA